MSKPSPKDETSLERAMREAEEKKKKAKDAPPVDKMQRSPVVNK